MLKNCNNCTTQGCEIFTGNEPNCSWWAGPASVLDHFDSCEILSTIKQEEDEAGWLAARTKGLGGSDVGTICGVNNFSNARQLYLKKTGQFQDDFESTPQGRAAKERMHFGHVLEPIVANEFAERTGKKVVESPATLKRKSHPWALANVDRFIIDDEGKPYGILECKTAGEFMNDHWDEGEIPLSYIYQLNWYLWITDLTYGAFACLVGGNKFYYYEVFRNDELLQNEIIPKADKFWNHNIANLIEPDLDGSATSVEQVNEANKDVQKGSEIVLAEDEYNLLAETVIEGKLKMKEIEKIVNEASNRLKDKMKSHEYAFTTDHAIRWAPRSQRRIDNDKLKIEYPEVYEACTKEISFRVMTVK